MDPLLLHTRVPPYQFASNNPILDLDDLFGNNNSTFVKEVMATRIINL